MTDIRITRGNPDDCELAALLVVITALGAVPDSAPAEETHPAPWNRPARYRNPAVRNQIWTR